MNNLKYYKEKNNINFGDDINPILYKAITGRYPNHIHIKSKGRAYMMIGSILRYANKSNIIWGTGAMYENSNINPASKICAVRGPFTRNVVLKTRDSCPEVYGDPALLLPRYFQFNIVKKYKLGIIPHFFDNSLFTNINIPNDFKLLDVTISPIDFIKQSLECENIISSSLHGLILADAYNIPSLWVEFSDKVQGNGFKFKDYYASVGKDNQTPLVINKISNINWKDILNKIKAFDIKIDLDKLLEACPFNS